MQNTQTISTRTASHAVLGVHTKASLRTISLIALAAVAFATAPTAARADNPACGTTGATQEENPVV